MRNILKVLYKDWHTTTEMRVIALQSFIEYVSLQTAGSGHVGSRELMGIHMQIFESVVKHMVILSV